jgi:hypothetical protein
MIFEYFAATPGRQLPTVVASAAAAAREAGLGQREEVIDGDFFDSVPEGDRPKPLDYCLLQRNLRRQTVALYPSNDSLFEAAVK